MKEINKCIDWYMDNYNNASIEQLLGLSDKLAILSCTLAETVANSAGNYLRAYFDRKLLFAGHKITFHEQGNSLSKSDDMATLEIKNVRQKEIDEEVKYKAIELKLKQVNKLLSSIQQRISYLKQEKQRMNNLGNNQNQK